MSLVSWVPHKNINTELVNKLLQNSLSTNTFTNGGPNVALLETIIREKLKIDDNKSVVAINNGTSALHAVAACIDLMYNKKHLWATQSFTFPSSAQGYLENAMIIDIDTEGGLDLNLLNPEEIDGIIVTNIFGNVVDIDKYTTWAQKYDKYLVFDNAATAYTFYKGTNSCNYGTAATISFHHTKPIGFGEGGAIIIDKKYEISLRRIMNFGINNNIPTPWNRLGSNYKMSDVMAVYIIQYLDKFNEIVEHHKNLYKHFVELYPNNKMYKNFSDDVPFLSCFCLLDDKYDIKYLERMLETGVYCRKYYNPLLNTPVAMQLYDQIICLPCTIDVKPEDLHKYILL